MVQSALEGKYLLPPCWAAARSLRHKVNSALLPARTYSCKRIVIQEYGELINAWLRGSDKASPDYGPAALRLG